MRYAADFRPFLFFAGYFEYVHDAMTYFPLLYHYWYRLKENATRVFMCYNRVTQDRLAYFPFGVMACYRVDRGNRTRRLPFWNFFWRSNCFVKMCPQIILLATGLSKGSIEHVILNCLWLGPWREKVISWCIYQPWATELRTCMAIIASDAMI